MHWQFPVDPRLQSRLRATQPERLVQLLAELCVTNRGVAERVEALLLAEDPVALAEALQQRIQAIATDNYVEYNAASQYADKLEAIIDDVGGHLLPRDPQAALRLTTEFIALDAKVFENMDDSGNNAGAVFERAVDLFHQAASALDQPHISEPLMRQLLENDEYGVRDFLANPRTQPPG